MRLAALQAALGRHERARYARCAASITLFVFTAALFIHLSAVAAAAAAHPATADPPPRIAVPWTSEATIAARTSIAAAC